MTNEGELHKRQRRLVQPAFHQERLRGYAEAMAECADGMRSQWFSAPTSATRIHDALQDVLESFGMAQVAFSRYLEKIPLPSTRRFRKARQRLDATILRIIANRRASREDRGIGRYALED